MTIVDELMYKVTEDVDVYSYTMTFCGSIQRK